MVVLLAVGKVASKDSHLVDYSAGGKDSARVALKDDV